MDKQPGAGLLIDRIEHAVRAIWMDILHTGEMTISDSYTARGGDSSGAMRIVSQIYERFGVEMSLAEFLEADTIRNCSMFIYRMMAATSDAGNAAAADVGYI